MLILFFAYLVLWTVTVSGGLISGCALVCAERVRGGLPLAGNLSGELSSWDIKQRVIKAKPL